MQFRTGPSAYATFYIGEIGDTIPTPRTAAIGMLAKELGSDLQKLAAEINPDMRAG
jgi:hypothetical protein